MNNAKDKTHLKSKILFLTSRADLGGGPLHMLQLMKGLQGQAGLEIFSASPHGQEFSQEFKENSTKWYALPFRGLSLWALILIAYECQKNEVKIMHSHGRGAGLYGALIKIFLGDRIKWVHTFHGLHYPQGILSWFKKLFDQMITARCADAVVCLSQEEERAARWDLKIQGSVFYIPNGVDFNSINRFLQNQMGRDLSGPQVQIGLLARNDPVKGIFPFLDKIRWGADEKLWPKEFQIKLAGPGMDQEEKQFHYYLSHFSLELLGPLKRGTQVPDSWFFLSKLNVFVSPSLNEGMPLAVLEALAFRIPCVLSDIPVHRQLAQFMPSLITLAPLMLDRPLAESAIFWIEAIKSAGHQKVNLKELQTFEKNFSFEKVIKQHCDLYNSLPL